MSAYTLLVRSLHDEDPLGAKRCLLHATRMQEMGLATGDVVCATPAGSTEPISLCVAWPASDIGLSKISLSYNSAKALSLDASSKIQLWKPSPEWAQQIRLAARITIKEISPAPASESAAQRADWLKLFARETLIDLKYILKDQVFEVPFEGKPRLFQVISFELNGEPAKSDIAEDIAVLSLDGELNWIRIAQSAAELDWDTQLHIQENKKSKPPPVPADVGSPYSTVGGLEKQIAAVRDLIEIPLTNPQLFHQFGLKPPKGILLHGPPGTGKTHLARAIAKATNASLLAISGAELASAFHGETEARLRAVFADARRRSPCVIVLDEVDAMCPRREDSGGGGVEARVVATLLTEMDGIDVGGGETGEGADDGGDRRPRIVVVATTNRPNAIDPALRRPGRFDREIEIGVPDVSARLAILQVLLRGAPHVVSLAELQALAGRTHGYVGADLGALVRDAGTRAIKRTLLSPPNPGSTASGDVTPTPAPSPITNTDLLSALLTTRPSALRELALETPHTRWSDVGGQASVQARLRESVEWPLRHPEAFARLGVRPPGGVLMYGPPGCSKTLIARALATESGVNFVSVKGPELLNKYVGESERAVREIFRKARGAAPSIIFFDEIDALATARESADGRAHEGVLTSLLTEMDGVQELLGVTVVAATNRPDVLDSALMRPGRLDKLLYVGPPDKAGRVEILRIRTRKMSVDPELDLDILADLTDGCSGAEIAALCQDAALMTMRADISALFVSRVHFEQAAREMKRQITKEMVAGYEAFGAR
ncbi:AAA family ATPase [Ceratobasidium sp. AG-I]|nr:AAA family ATPase [Ceratobasidium sp. AG-I]